MMCLTQRLDLFGCGRSFVLSFTMVDVGVYLLFFLYFVVFLLSWLFVELKFWRKHSLQWYIRYKYLCGCVVSFSGKIIAIMSATKSKTHERNTRTKISTHSDKINDVNEILNEIGWFLCTFFFAHKCDSARC